MRLTRPSVFLIRCGPRLGDPSPPTVVDRAAETALELLQARPGSRVDWYIAILILMEGWLVLYAKFPKTLLNPG
jgi:hypothetical protein